MPKNITLFKIFMIIDVFTCLTARFIGCYALNSSFAVLTFIKALASGFAMALGVVLYLKKKSKLGLFLSIGLVLCFLADIFLEFSFIGGGAFFVAAHIVFTTGFIVTKGIDKKQFIVFGILIILSIPAFYFSRNIFGSMMTVLIIYFVILFCTAAFSVTQSKIIIAGAFAFLLSDIFLMRITFVESPLILHIISLYSYYASLVLLALGCEEKQVMKKNM